MMQRSARRGVCVGGGGGVGGGWGGIFGDYHPNWQQAEDAASFRRSNLASAIADTISPRGAAGGAETEV